MMSGQDIQNILESMPEEMRRDVMFGAVNAFKDLIGDCITNLEKNAMSVEPLNAVTINSIYGSADVLRLVFGIEKPTR